MPRIPEKPQTMIDTWIFDLDNTLYPASSDLFAQVHQRMGEFIADYLKVDLAEAQRLQKLYFREHGTTLRGLMTVHDMDPAAFLDHVHEIDLTGLAPAAALDRALDGLSGRKLVFTNGSIRHAERVLARLGLARHFEGIVDIAACRYVPKPDPAGYDLICRRFGIDPRRAAMVEDIARNLQPAAALGMLTVWVSGGPDWAHEGSTEDWVHHRTDDLARWLTEFRGSPAG